MKYKNRIEDLKKSLNIKENKKGKHTINEKAIIIPFKTRNPERPKFLRGFVGVAGEVSRIVSKNKLCDGTSIEEYIEGVVKKVECKNEEDRNYLKDIIRSYLVDKDGDVNVFNPHLYQYVKLTEGSEKKGEEDIARFICDVVLDGNDELKKIFEKTDTDHIITKLILNEVDALEERSEKRKYHNVIPGISDVANEDFNFMMENSEFFIKNYQKLLAYYYFLYITQVSLKLNKRGLADYNKLEEIYYLLDWEVASRNRKSINRGYDLIRNENKNVLVNINVLEHLNFIFGEEGKTFTDLKSIYEVMDDEEKDKLCSAMQSWIRIYRQNQKIEEEIELTESYEELVEALYKSITQGLDAATISRYSLSIQEIGRKYFLKFRGGNYGYMLNMTQDMVLLITAVSIKEEKITLKALFDEYERRGLYFDQYSKELIVILLEKLNLIDKKSDSGDAQYVRKIL